MIPYSIENIKSADTLHYIIEYVGVNSPVFLYIVSNYILRQRLSMAFLFNAGFFSNICVNSWLKYALKHERPAPLITDRKSANYYGMPSGHAQMLSYMATFIYFTSTQITNLYFLGFVLLFFWGCAERYVDKKHTIGQLAVGACIGCLIAYIVLFASAMYENANANTNHI